MLPLDLFFFFAPEMASVISYLWMIAPNVTAVQLINAVRSDTNLPPAGVSFPINYTGTGQFWQASFTDPAGVAPSYWCQAVQTAGGNQIPFQFSLVSGVPQVAGFFTSQPVVEALLGQFNADQLSNLNNSNTAPSLFGFADAIQRSEAVLNLELAQFFYSNGASNPSFPASSYAFPMLAMNATELAAAWVYSKRGSYDGSDQMAGKFAQMGREAVASVKRIIRNKIYDVPRYNLSYQPTIVLNPSLWPFGNPNPLSGLSSNMLPTYPYANNLDNDTGPSS